jgi:hypothetical protein
MPPQAGSVRDLSVVSGRPLLRNAAIDAVRQWIYKPPLLNGESVEIVAPIAVIFQFNWIFSIRLLPHTRCHRITNSV